MINNGVTFLKRFTTKSLKSNTKSKQTGVNWFIEWLHEKKYFSNLENANLIKTWNSGYLTNKTS